jgi:hypothetical protein
LCAANVTQSQQQSHDKLKRKSLLAPNPVGNDAPPGFGGTVGDSQAKHGTFGMNIENNIGAVVGGMEANGVGGDLLPPLTNCSSQVAD